MTPTTPPPEGTPGNTNLSTTRLVRGIGAVLAVAVLLAGFAVAFQLAHGASSTGTSRSLLGQASGANTPAGQSATTTGTGIATATAHGAPGAAATATNVPAPPPSGAVQRNDVRVTANQDMRPACTNDPPPSFTVQLANAGNMAVSWQAVFPMAQNDTGKYYWGTAQPASGSLGAGQSASFVISVIYSSIPCGGDSYTASVKLTYPAGNWQPDIPLTYAGTGPIPQSHVVLVSGTLNVTEACRASGVAPAPFTFAIKNTGTAIGYTSIDTTKDWVGGHYWADISSVTFDPPDPAVTTWLYPGETWTVTIAPHAGVLCDGTVYHVYIYINDSRAPSATMTITDTFK